ncbi:MAG: hypothetical protein LBV28_04255, partial [Puniceicoccales bacterium]|nr:hypothetical protein [Puniceicoccales bacterium]
MNDEHFHQLLNSYLDGELPVSDRPAFRKALQESAHYRVVLRQQMRLQAAQRAAVLRTPRLHTSLFGLISSSRLCRGGAVLMNAAVLLFAVS